MTSFHSAHYANRRTSNNIPPRIDYTLTPLGLSLTVTLSALAGWASANRLRIEAACSAHDADATDGLYPRAS